MPRLVHLQDLQRNFSWPEKKNWNWFESQAPSVGASFPPRPDPVNRVVPRHAKTLWRRWCDRRYIYIYEYTIAQDNWGSLKDRTDWNSSSNCAEALLFWKSLFQYTQLITIIHTVIYLQINKDMGSRVSIGQFRNSLGHGSTLGVTLPVMHAASS